MKQKNVLMIAGGIALISVAAYVLLGQPAPPPPPNGYSAEIVSVEVT